MELLRSVGRYNIKYFLTKKTFLLMLVVGVGVMVLGCWKKQKHDITAPETPVYTVAGRIMDVDTNELLGSMRVVITAQELVYKYDFETAADTSDQNGFYEFTEMISPGTYNISVYRGGLAAYSHQIVVEHADKEFDIEIPKIMIAKIDYPSSVYQACANFSGFDGIHWRYNDGLAGITMYWADQFTKWGWGVVIGNFSDGFEVVGKKNNIAENPSMHGLAFLGNYWSVWDDDGKTNIVSIDPARGNFDGVTQVHYALVDLTSDSTSLWATAAIGKIIQYGQHPSIVVQEYDTEIVNPAGIAWDGKNIWTSDNVESMLYKHKPDLSVAESYRIYYWGSQAHAYILLNLSYLSFDVKGNLWGGDGSALYEFRF